MCVRRVTDPKPDRLVDMVGGTPARSTQSVRELLPPWVIEGSLGARFAAQAAHHAGRPALIEADGVTSYAALNTWSRRIAAAVRAAGVQAGDPVGVMVEQGAAQIAAIFGALRAGAIYVPLPVVCLRTIIGDAGLRTLVTDRMNRSRASWLVPAGRRRAAR